MLRWGPWNSHYFASFWGFYNQLYPVYTRDIVVVRLIRLAAKVYTRKTFQNLVTLESLYSQIFVDAPFGYRGMQKRPPQ